MTAVQYDNLPPQELPQGMTRANSFSEVEAITIESPQRRSQRSSMELVRRSSVQQETEVETAEGAETTGSRPVEEAAEEPKVAAETTVVEEEEEVVEWDFRIPAAGDEVGGMETVAEESAIKVRREGSSAAAVAEGASSGQQGDKRKKKKKKKKR
jgi:hypothetical protein